MQLLKYCKILLLSLLLALLSETSEAKKVIFYGKSSVLKSELLITQNRAKPCPKGQLLDHRNRCRKVLNFSVSK
ncbi:hypothetical protein FF38_05466 [Lucilia cuprina]|uniref:Secreted protein n=1 Tax=Lucilia cuprina TaxID=7375 RepID=A0A0L0C0G4_LUCCU|nr:hypothetical protein FF38_05466 [Lucilia cuprina]